MERHRQPNQKYDADRHRSKAKSLEDLRGKLSSKSTRERQNCHSEKSLEIASTQVVVPQKHILTNPLSGEDEYVRMWLAQTLEDPDLGSKRKQHATFCESCVHLRETLLARIINSC